MLLLRGNRAGDRFRTQAIEGRSNSSFAYLISRLGRRFKDCFQLNGRPERKARHAEHETRRQLVIPENVAEELRAASAIFTRLKSLPEFQALTGNELSQIVAHGPVLIIDHEEPKFVAQSIEAFEAMVRDSEVWSKHPLAGIGSVSFPSLRPRQSQARRRTIQPGCQPLTLARLGGLHHSYTWGQAA